MKYGYKKQHTIPESYLKAWCDPNTPEGHEPFVWMFSKDGQQVKKRAPGNIFRESDFYTIKRIDGTRDLVLEHGLQELESEFARVKREVVFPMLDLSAADKIILCAFTAGMHSRTKAQQEHARKQWTPALEMMKSMQEQISSLPPEQARRLASQLSPPGAGTQPGITVEEVEKIVESPMQSLLGIDVAVEAPLLLPLDIAIFCTSSVHGFITSDHPCVWFDPEAYKRAPYYRVPALMYESIEITLPISPSHALVLNRRALTGYKQATTRIVDELNRRTRYHAYEYFVASRKEQNPYWFVADPRQENNPIS